MMFGCTIREAQKRLPISEFYTWLAYRKKYGPMNPVRKYDVGPAILASIISKAHGGRATPQDFLAYGKEEADIEVGEKEFISALGVRAKYGKRR